MPPSLSRSPMTRGWLATLALWLGLAGTASAQSVPEPGASLPTHCIGDQPLAVPPGGLRAWLEEADRSEVVTALMAKYPTLQRDGLDARALLLWRHSDGDWRYAALIADQRKPGQRCVAASFSAASVTPTATMLRKYFFASGEPS